jgi:CheY-like chemotaxis protein
MRMNLPPIERAALVLDADHDTLGLLREWLGEAGWSVHDAAVPHGKGRTVDLILIDLAHPRRGDAAVPLQAIAAEHPRTPVLALSAMFHANVEPHGDVARQLQVDGVLPKPIRREALLAAVRRATAPPS